MSQADKFKLNLFKGAAILMLLLWLIVVIVSLQAGIIATIIISIFFAVFILFCLGICGWILGIKKIAEKQNKALHR